MSTKTTIVYKKDLIAFFAEMRTVRQLFSAILVSLYFSQCDKVEQLNKMYAGL